MADKSSTYIVIVTLLAGALAACGQKGPLYLPDAPGEVVTRPPEASPPPQENTTAPNSPQTIDEPALPPSPAPEVTAPVGTPDAGEPKKEKGAAPPQPPPQ